MVKGVTGSAGVIFEQIETLFMDQVGPIAPILAQEALNDWVAELSAAGQKPSLRNISSYIERLAKQVIDPSDRIVFIESVFEISALKPYKSLYKGAH
jgi:hypothetical protein